MTWETCGVEDISKYLDILTLGLSCTIWLPCNDINFICGRHLRRRGTLLCEACMRARIVFNYCYLGIQPGLRIFEMLVLTPHS